MLDFKITLFPRLYCSLIHENSISLSVFHPYNNILAIDLENTYIYQ